MVQFSSGFNPYRVFSGSATVANDIVFRNSKRFQSLSGFLGLCNWVVINTPERSFAVSIPIGFSRALQLLPLTSNPRPLSLFQSLSGFLGLCNSLPPLLPSLRYCVSIPIGVSRALQLLQEQDKSRLQMQGFNPYRVFSGSATQVGRSSLQRHRKVSIPIGFSRALQRHRLTSTRSRRVCFNPYRVFSGSATKNDSVPRPQKSICFNPYRVFSGSAT